MSWLPGGCPSPAAGSRSKAIWTSVPAEPPWIEKASASEAISARPKPSGASSCSAGSGLKPGPRSRTDTVMRASSVWIVTSSGPSSPSSA